MRGGPRDGAGRPRGSRNKRLAEAIEAVAAAGVRTPLAYMLAVMNDPTASPERRDRMALAAAPFLHSRLSSVAWLPTKESSFDLSLDDDGGHDFALDFVKQLTNGET